MTVSHRSRLNWVRPCLAVVWAARSKPESSNTMALLVLEQSCKAKGLRAIVSIISRKQENGEIGINAY